MTDIKRAVLNGSLQLFIEAAAGNFDCAAGFVGFADPVAVLAALAG